MANPLIKQSGNHRQMDEIWRIGMGGVRGDPQICLKWKSGSRCPGVGVQKGRSGKAAELGFEELGVTVAHPGRGSRRQWQDGSGASAPRGTLSPAAKRNWASFPFISLWKANLVLYLRHVWLWLKTWKTVAPGNHPVSAPGGQGLAREARVGGWPEMRSEGMGIVGWAFLNLWAFSPF